MSNGSPAGHQSACPGGQLFHQPGVAPGAAGAVQAPQSRQDGLQLRSGGPLPLEQDGQNADEPLYLHRLRPSQLFLYHTTEIRQLSVMFLFPCSFYGLWIQYGQRRESIFFWSGELTVLVDKLKTEHTGNIWICCTSSTAYKARGWQMDLASD